MISSISNIAQDPLSMAFDYLDFPDQAAAALCCRRWKNVINHGSFQKEVLRRASLKDKIPLSSYIKANNIAALVIKAIVLFERKPTYTVNVLYIDELLAKARKLPVKFPFSNYAAFYRAQLKVFYPESPLGDSEAFNILEEVVQNAQLSEGLLAKAQFLKARLRVDNRTNSITNAEAFNLLDHVANNKSAVKDIRVIVQYYKAHLKIFDRTMPISDDDAFNLFDLVANSNLAPSPLRANSLTGKAYLRFCDRTELITDEAAFELLNQVPKIESAAYTEAQYLKARFKVRNRTEEITDDEAFTLFDDAASTKINSEVLFSSMYYKAYLKIHNRTERITDDQALVLLDSITSNMDLSAEVRNDALNQKMELIRRQRAQNACCVIL